MTQEPSNIEHAMEQAEACIRDAAPVMATYYHTLKQGDVPHDLAAALTVEFSKIFWSAAFNPQK